MKYYSELNNDERGFFCELSKRPSLQLNLAYTLEAGTLRGFHGQLNQSKNIIVIDGAIFDVMVNPEDGQIYTYELEAYQSVFVPSNWLHAYYSLTDDVKIIYQVDEYYNKAEEFGVHYKSFDIKWPGKIRKISEKDSKLPIVDFPTPLGGFHVM